MTILNNAGPRGSEPSLEEKIKALQDDYTELNKDYASLYNEHRDLMSDHTTLKRDHALLEADLKNTNRNLSTITNTVGHIVRVLGMQRTRLGSGARSSVLANIVERNNVQDDTLNSVSRKVHSQLEETKKVIQDQEERRLEQFTEQFTEQARVIDDKVFKILYLLHNENTGGISHEQFDYGLKQLFDQTIAEGKGCRQTMSAEPMEGVDEDLVHPDVEEDEEVEQDGIQSKYWP